MDAQAKSGLIKLALLIMGVLLAASQGSMSSVKREWHREDIYSRCIRPHVTSVFAVPFCVGCVLGMLVLAGFRYLEPAPAKVPGLSWQETLVALAAGGSVAFFMARRRGTEVYSAAVRKFGA
jgi:hypothetical protein